MSDDSNDSVPKSEDLVEDVKVLTSEVSDVVVDKVPVVTNIDDPPKVSVGRGVWTNILLVFGICLMLALAIFSTYYYTHNIDYKEYKLLFNESYNNYTTNLDLVARQFYNFGYGSAINGLYNYLDNCTIVGVTDPVSNLTVQVRDITCN